jgi:hypothetical protein
MGRSLDILFRRDPSRDRIEGGIQFEGYRMCWPDGTPVSVGVDALCSHGQRLLGLGALLAGRQERLLELIAFPQVTGRENMTRLAGHRVRRFFVERNGQSARMHFMDGTPTSIVFDYENDDERLLHWLGMYDLDEGERSWFDLAARAVGEAVELAGAMAGSYDAAVRPSLPA